MTRSVKSSGEAAVDRKVSKPRRMVSFRTSEEAYQSLFQIAARRTISTGKKCTASSVIESLILAAAKKELSK